MKLANGGLVGVLLLQMIIELIGNCGKDIVQAAEPTSPALALGPILA